MSYRGDNQVLSCTYGNGLTDTRSYDLQGRLTHQLLQTPSNQIVDDRSYSYDANSNVTAMDTNYEDNVYQYDKRDRLITDSYDEAISSVMNSVFSYDLNDNRLNHSRNIDNTHTGDTIYSYASNSNRLLEQEHIDLTQSQAEMIDLSMVYNDVGRLYQVYDQGNQVADYIYNDNGQRIRKTTYTNGTPTEITIYHYDQRGLLITETDEQGNLKRDYIWSETTQPLAQITNESNTESIVYLHNDHLLTNRLATDQNQEVVWRWEGEAFGNTSPNQDPDGDGQVTTINLRFPGQYRDEETNWFYNWNRYYSPDLGRYITSDRIGLDGGFNTYAYALQNPNKYFDPNGKAATLAWCFGGPAACAGALAITGVGVVSLQNEDDPDVFVEVSSPNFCESEPPPDDACIERAQLFLGACLQRSGSAGAIGCYAAYYFRLLLCGSNREGDPGNPFL